jgi:PadR family transcriptional regulator, regulatory protein PadR
VSRASRNLRPTLQMLKVLRVLLDHPNRAHYGLELSKRAALATGTIYPILTRLEQAGWVRSNWEDAEPSDAGRPRRRLYWLTDDGAEKAVTVLEEGREAILPEEGRRPRLPTPGGREAPA